MTRPTVLVAEDDPSVRMTLEFVLEGEGFDVVLAANGEEALELATATRPDVILLDHMMPKMSGREVLSALRRQAATEAIPVFVLSGIASDLGDEWAGAEFIGKPFVPDMLVKRIKHALEDGL